MKLIIVLLISTFFISCTRSLDDKSGLKLMIPSSSKLEAQQTTMFPMFAAVNVHYSDRPTISRSFELKDRFDDSTATNDPNAGTSTELEIFVPSIAQGSNTLVQLLVVYEDPNSGALEFNYGDVVSDISGGENLLDITVAAIGTSTQEIMFAGRYLTAANQGPTGLVSMMLHPPNGKPAMEVEKEPINNGWFNFFHPGGGAQISYVLKAQKKVLFNKITETSSEFTTGNHLIKVDMPSHFRKDGFGYYANQVAANLYFGFFKDPNSTLDLSSYQACYSTRPHSVPGAYLTAYPGFNSLLYNPGGTAGTDVVVSGGIPMSFTNVYNSTSCDLSTGTNVVFHTEHMGNRGLEDVALGMQGPFAMMNPFQQHDSAFVNSTFTGSSIDLNWSYLPGVLGTSVSGTSIFAKHDPYGGGGDGYDDFDCRENAELQAMIEIADVTNENYSYTGAGGLPSPSDPAVYPRDFKFMLCPYKQTASGERLYARRGVSVHCIGGCEEPFNFGLGDTDGNISTTDIGSVPDAYGAHVSNMTINSNSIDLSTAAGWGGAGTFTDGDEVVLNVIAAGNDGQCSSTGSDPVGPGFFMFTRVLYANGSLITIPRNSRLETINTSELSVTPQVGNDFCFMTITKVLHYRNLNIAGVLSASGADILTFYAKNIFIKVSGTLTFTTGGGLDASGKGFLGGAFDKHGSGALGPQNTATATGTGGRLHEGGNIGGGGASYGSGGSNDNFNRASGLMNDYGMYMGGGGAGDGGNNGANGGGIIYLASRHVDVQADTMMQANGGDSGGGGQGAGAGGSIWFLFDEISNPGPSTFTISANGGGSDTGGSGAGGLLKGDICMGDTSAFSFNNFGGATSGTSDQQGEAGNYFDIYSSDFDWVCEN